MQDVFCLKSLNVNITIDYPNVQSCHGIISTDDNNHPIPQKVEAGFLLQVQHPRDFHPWLQIEIMLHTDSVSSGLTVEMI